MESSCSILRQYGQGLILAATELSSLRSTSFPLSWQYTQYPLIVIAGIASLLAMRHCTTLLFRLSTVEFVSCPFSFAFSSLRPLPAAELPGQELVLLVVPVEDKAATVIVPQDGNRLWLFSAGVWWLVRQIRCCSCCNKECSGCCRASLRIAERAGATCAGEVIHQSILFSSRT